VLRDHTRFWTWQTEAVRDFLEWARAFNDGRDPADQLRCYGYDAQFVDGSVAALDDFLADAAPGLHEDFADQLDVLAEGVGRDAEHAPDPDDVATLESLAGDLPTALDDRKCALADATSAREWRVVRHHARILEQAAERFRATLAADGSMSAEAFAARDRAMAENIAWLLDHEPHDTVAVWAHDGHIMRGSLPMPNDERAETMGSFLDDRFGADYYPLGFTFDRGAFRAYDGTAEEMERRVFEVDSIENSLGDALAATGHDAGFLDVAAARDAGLDDWVDASHEKRAIGAVYDPTEPEEYRRPEPLAATFDGVLFVADTTASRGLGD
jgi:erythromycin esterase